MINKIYMDEEISKEIKKEYLKNKPSRTVLQGFFTENVYEKIRKKFNVTSGCKVRVAERYSYEALDVDAEVRELFSSEEFLEFFKSATGKEIETIELYARRYGWKDYTLLHDSENKTVKEGTDFFFFILPTGIKEWDYFWGGSKIYHLDRGKGKSLVFTPSHNSLCLVQRRKKDMNFVQYINHYVGKESFVIIEGKISNS